MFVNLLKASRGSIRALTTSQMRFIHLKNPQTTRVYQLNTLPMAKFSDETHLGSKRINTKTLCDLIGSRYYESNEEIEMHSEKLVRCFDENDSIIGDMTLHEAQ